MEPPHKITILQGKAEAYKFRILKKPKTTIKKMVSKTELKRYSFQRIEDYENSIIENETNGNRADVRKMINKFSRGQKRSFLHSLYRADDEETKEVRTILLESI